VQAKTLFNLSIRIGKKDRHVGVAFIVDAAACRHWHSRDPADFEIFALESADITTYSALGTLAFKHDSKTTLTIQTLN
jgi:hypothetical protein